MSVARLRSPLGLHTAAQFRTAAVESMAVDTADLAAAVLALLLVLRLTRMQHRKALSPQILVPALG
ncbi:hypothetical protein ACWDZX_17500 [Streptomyces collinus]